MEHLDTEELFDKVAYYLYGNPKNYARKEFILFLFTEWTKTNMDIVFEAIVAIQE